jgi:hypothetical protein
MMTAAKHENKPGHHRQTILFSALRCHAHTLFMMQGQAVRAA